MSSTTYDYTGKVAFVTGAGSGIGRATAQAFAAAGAHVALADLNEDGLAETARLIEDAGGAAHSIRTDVADEQSIIAALEETVRVYGKLDFAANAAGINQPDAIVGEIDTATWDRVLTIDLRGVFLSMKHELPLLESNGGAIVNISSGAGVKAFPNGAAYGAAKHGVVGLTKVAALEYADKNIRINAIAPGIIETPMSARVFGEGQQGYDRAASQEPVGRLGQPEEIAGAVLWLCADETTFMIGHTLVMDGGQTI